MSIRSSDQALAAAMATSVNRVGLCLWQVQDWWQSGHEFPTATAQWEATRQHRDREIPLAAPVFYGGPGAGHVALYAGRGMVRSTDAPRPGRVGTVPLAWPTAIWNRGYLGWGSTLAGRALTLVPPAPAPDGVVYLSRLHYGQMASDSVALLQARLNETRFPPYSDVPVTGNYGMLTDSMVRAWQASIGDAVDRIAKSSIGPLQAARLWRGTTVQIRP